METKITYSWDLNELTEHGINPEYFYDILAEDAISRILAMHLDGFTSGELSTEIITDNEIIFHIHGEWSVKTAQS